MTEIVRPLDGQIAKMRYVGAVKTLEKILRVGPDPEQIVLHRRKIHGRLAMLLGLHPRSANEFLEFRRKMQSRTGKLIALNESSDPHILALLLHRYRVALARLEDTAVVVQIQDVLPMRDPAEASPWHRAWELSETAVGNRLLMKAFCEGRPDAMVTVARKLLTSEHAPQSRLIDRAVQILAVAAQAGNVSAEADLLRFSAGHEGAYRALDRLRVERIMKLLRTCAFETDA